jgi:IclR family mhp operon transcriptional activator
MLSKLKSPGTSPTARRCQAYTAIASLRKGLKVLADIGQHGANVASIARHTGINRTTIYRILATLEQDGYLNCSPTNHQFRPSPKVRLLSDGFTDVLWIAQIAAPVLMRLLHDTAWPGNLATFNGRYMVFRESTHRFSSFFVHKPMIGREIPLSTALGQAYLAFSGASVRKPLLPAFAADWKANGFGAIVPADAEQLLVKVRAKGYATAVSSLEPNVAAVAMPILSRGQVLACVNVVMTPEALSTPAVLKSIRSQLAEAIRTIERRIDGELP